MEPTLYHLALGSNIGDRTRTIEAAIDAIDSIGGVIVRARSPILLTPAMTVEGSAPQRDYRNAVIAVETTMTPRELLERCQEIEQALGRERSAGERWAPRTIDIDIVLAGDLVIDEPGLTIPHPGLADRRFVLEPLAAIAPEARHPVLKKSIADLLGALAVVIAMLLAVAPAPAMAQQEAPAEQAPIIVDPDEAYRSIASAYREGPIAERVSVTAVSKFGRRVQTATIAVDAPGNRASLTLGSIRAVADRNELRIVHEDRGDRYARFAAQEGETIADLVATALPPIPMPQLALAFDPIDAPPHLAPVPGVVRWTQAMQAPGADHLLLMGEVSGAIVSYIVDPGTWRLSAAAIASSATGLHIEMSFEPLDAEDPALWSLPTEGKVPVPTLAQLQPGGVDIHPGAPAPPMVFFTISSVPWRLDTDQEGPIAMLFLREISEGILEARDAMQEAARAHVPSIDTHAVLITGKLVGIDLFERIGQTVHAYGAPVLWTASSEATIERFTDGPACVVVFDADRVVRAVIDIGDDDDREAIAQRIAEAIGSLGAD